MDKASDMAGRMAKMPKGTGIGMGALIAAGAMGYAAYQSVYTVDGGHRAIMFNRIGGVGHQTVAEGLHFRIPWFQYPIVYDVRARPNKISSPTGSKDLQMVQISLRVLSRPDSSKLQQIYRQLGTDWDERVLPSICNETLKAVVAKFNASQLITMRQQVSLMIRKDLTDKAKDFNIHLDDVAITDLTFGREYSAAVEAKQVAAQEAQRAQFAVEKAKQERAQKIVQAEGEGAAARLLGKAISEDPGYLKLRKIRAAQAIAKTVSGATNRTYLNSGSLMLNIADKDFYTDADIAAKKKR